MSAGDYPYFNLHAPLPQQQFSQEKFGYVEIDAGGNGATALSTYGNILLHDTNKIQGDGAVLDGNSNVPYLSFNSSAVNISGTLVTKSLSTYGNIDLHETNKIRGDGTGDVANTANVPSISFNGSSVNISGTLLSLNSGVDIPNLANDPRIPIVREPPTTESWATPSRLYFYQSQDSNYNGITYLCVVPVYSPLTTSGIMSYFSADSTTVYNIGDTLVWEDLYTNTEALPASSTNQPVYHTSDTLMNDNPCVHFTSHQCFKRTIGFSDNMTVAMVLYSATSPSVVCCSIPCYDVTNQYLSTNTPSILIATMYKTSSTTYERDYHVNGEAKLGSTGNVMTSNYDVCSIGNSYLATGTFQGGIAACLVFRGALSYYNRQKLEGFLAWKWWGNGTVLPEDHPYNSVKPE